MLIQWSLIGLAAGSLLSIAVERGPWSRAVSGPTVSPGTVRWSLPIATAAMSGWLATLVPDLVMLAIYGCLAAALLLLAALDARYRIVPNAIVLPATVGAVAVGPAGPLSALAGALVGLAFFGALYWMGRKLFGVAALGMGDVKLAMLIGAVVGMAHVWPALLLGMLLGGATAVWLLATRRAERGMFMPYGSFLALAGVIAFAWFAPG